MRRAALILCILFATLMSRAQVADGQALIAATLSDSTVYEVMPTGSMEPGLNESHWIAVKKLPWKDMRETDVILYQSKKTDLIVVHAVWRRSSGGSALICKGWHNPTIDDELVTEDMYLGTVVGIIKRPRADSP